MCQSNQQYFVAYYFFLDSGIQFKIVLIPGYCSLFGHQNVLDWKKMKLIGNKC